MVGREEQARLHGDRYFGGATSVNSVQTAGQLNYRTIHPEESRNYWITTSGSDIGFLIVNPPLDARHLEIGGPHFTLFNNPTSVNLFYVVDRQGVTSATVRPGESTQLYLLDNSTANGVWVALRAASNGITSGPRTFLS